MPGDFNKPNITDQYLDVLQSVKDLISDVSKMLDSTSTLNVPLGAIKWSSSNNRFEKYDGSIWQPLSSSYSINVNSLNGLSTGNNTGNIPVNNGTLNTNLNSQYLGGLSSTAFSRSSSSLPYSVQLGDTRSSNHLPQDRDPGSYFDFKSNSVDGLSDGGTFHRVFSLHGGSTGTDFIGSKASQLGFTDNGNIWTRSGSSSTWQAWTKLLSESNFNSTIGSGARKISLSTTVGSIKLNSSIGGYSGIEFDTGVGSDGRSIVSKNQQTGEFDFTNSVWKWRWDNGVLNVGSVPWSRITGAPTIQDLATYAIGTYIFGFAYDNNDSDSISKNIGETITRTFDPSHPDFGLDIRMRSAAGISSIPLLTTWKMLGMCRSGFNQGYGDEMTALWVRVS